MRDGPRYSGIQTRTTCQQRKSRWSDHLFGCFGVDHSLVITEDDYFDYLIGATKNRDQIPHFVRAPLAETALLFLGFEMDGSGLPGAFRRIMTQPVQLS